MAKLTKRVTVLVSPSEKERLISNARNAGMSVSEYLRFAVNGDDTHCNAVLNQIVDLLIESTRRAENSIDKTLQFVAESNRRIEVMEEKARKHIPTH